MKEINNFIIEKLKLNKDSKVEPSKHREYVDLVQRVYAYKTKDKETLIDYILVSFAEKCSLLIRRSPHKLDSTATYDIFEKNFCNRMSIDNPDNFIKIYSDIPDIFNRNPKLFTGFKITKEMVENMFGPGEFPIISIYANTVDDDTFTQVYYTISR
jgi:hypothetical protein